MNCSLSIMKAEKQKYRTANRFLFIVGIFFIVVGLGAVTVILMRDILAMSVPVRGNMIPLSLLTVMGAGLIWGSFRETGD